MLGPLLLMNVPVIVVLVSWYPKWFAPPLYALLWLYVPLIVVFVSVP